MGIESTLCRSGWKVRIDVNLSFRMLLILLVSFLSIGCGKKTALEGKVVDGAKHPLAGVLVKARMTLPIEGYERFEATTDIDGEFRFKKLFPESEYGLTAYGGNSSKSLEVKIISGNEGQAIRLPDPIEIRFVVSEDESTVNDTRTGLLWARNADIPGKLINLEEVQDWLNGMEIGGYHVWRLPTREELLDIAKYGGVRPDVSLNGVAFYNVEPSAYWTSSTHVNNPDHAWWVVDMQTGGEYNQSKYDKCYLWPVCDIR